MRSNEVNSGSNEVNSMRFGTVWHCLALFGTFSQRMGCQGHGLEGHSEVNLRTIWDPGTVYGTLGRYMGPWDGILDPGNPWVGPWQYHPGYPPSTTPPPRVHPPSPYHRTASALRPSAQRLRLSVKTACSGHPIYQATIGSVHIG